MSYRGRFGQRLPGPAAAVREEHAELRAAIDRSLEGLDIYRGGDGSLARGRETPIRELRRRGFPPSEDRLGTMSLVDEDGVLRWQPASSIAMSALRRRRRGLSPTHGTVVDQLRFERLAPSEVGAFLTRLDHKINPVLEASPAGRLRPLTRALALGSRAVQPATEGDVLLFVHGTFSHSENFHRNLTATEAGRELMARARERYSQVLFFDHATLQVSPVLNAVDLERQLRSSRARVDVVCHSRGGLVARWWCEALVADPTRIGRVVFVGSPLAGTSLAAPPKLKRTVDYLTNVFNVLSKVSGLAADVAPLMTVVTGLLKVLALAAKGVSRTPLLDVGVAAIPGLVGQSRVGDNAEIRRLREGKVPLERYWAVRSDFEPESVGWRFWRHFTHKPGQRVFDLGADLLFDDSNDLVVDTASMTDLESDLGQDISDERLCSFPTNGDVHHLNYFRQERTIRFLSEVLMPRDR